MLYIGPVPDLVQVLVWLLILHNHIQQPALAALAVVDSDFAQQRLSKWFDQPVGDLECWHCYVQRSTLLRGVFGNFL